MISVRILGPLEVATVEGPLKLGGRRQRAVLGALLLDHDRVVSLERLMTLLWGDEPPSRPEGTLQTYVSELRKILSRAGAVDVITTQEPGYRCRFDPHRLDVVRFRAGVADARSARRSGDLDAAADRLAGALGEWRGAALADLVGDALPRGVTRAVEAEREESRSEWIDLLLGLGRNLEALVPLEADLLARPAHEPSWAQLALALYRSGNQAAALRALQDARVAVADVSGVELGRELRRLERDILDRSPGLDLARPGPEPSEVTRTATSDLPTGPVGQLVLDDGSTVTLGRGVTVIGREVGEVRLPGDTVSRRHAEVRRSAAGYLLVDLTSKNGTFVGGEKVEGHLLEDGDQVGIGEHQLAFRLHPGQDPAP